MFAEDDLLPISALQHLIYCPRQCALIHLEQLWAENRLTVEGRQMHDNAHDPRKSDTRPGVRTTRGLPLRSFEIGLAGQADVVEFHDSPAGPPHVVPVEYKRGKPKKHDADSVQLCAQALCLEEMLNVSIEQGCLFYGRTRRRQVVMFDDALRHRTRQVAGQLHAMIRNGITPTAAYEKDKCDRCSLINLCMPQSLNPGKQASARYARTLGQSLRDA